MQNKPLSQTACPIARTLARVADNWSVLILREAFHGVTRFDAFQHNLGIAPNMLTRRLNSLVEEGLLERRRYCDRPPRSEYLLTERGNDFRPVLAAMLAWGSKYLVHPGEGVQQASRRTGERIEPVLPDASGHRATEADCHIAPGTTDRGRVRRRLNRAAEP
jgi:DNA-binding HxlR family transcriptional regulator